MACTRPERSKRSTTPNTCSAEAARGVEWFPAMTTNGIPASDSREMPSSATASAADEGW